MAIVLTTANAESWTGADGSSWPAQWTVAAGTGTIVSNKGRLTTPTATFSDARARLTSETNHIDSDVLLDLTIGPGAAVDQYFAICFRTQDTTISGEVGATNGYSILANFKSSGGFVQAWRNKTAGNTLISPTTGMNWVAGTAYTVRARCTGGRMQFRRWPTGSTEPTTWDLDVTDPTPYTTAGKLMVSFANRSSGGALYVDVDNLTLSAVTQTAQLTATVEAGHTPPRVRLDVTDPNTSSGSVTITRLDPDGVSRKVRTSDDQPLPLSGGTATVYDHEAPFGSPVTYSTDQAGTPSATVQVDSARPWLVHIGAPSRSVSPYHMLPGTNDSEVWDIDQGVFAVLGSRYPVVGTSGARLAPASRLVVYGRGAADLAALEQLLSDGTPLLLNVPPALGWGIDTCYIAVGKVTPSRPSPLLAHSARSIELPYQVIGRPAGGTQAAITWNDVAMRGADDYTAASGSKYATWSAVAAAVDSWAELAAPTS